MPLQQSLEQVTGENLETFLRVAKETPRQVVLAHSEKELRTGVPLSEIFQPPYSMSYLAFGVVLMGTCAVSGDSKWFSISQNNAVTARTVGRQDDGKRWHQITKDSRPLKVFMRKQPKRVPSQEVVES